jgi:phosphosulfolactate synthase
MSSDLIHLPPRSPKPRQTGLTAITDLGQPLGVLRDHLSSYHDYIDIAKFGVGSAYMEPKLAEKLAVYREFNVIPYFGGTLFEKFYAQSQFPAYLDYLRKHNVQWIEVSNGTVDFPLNERLKLVKQLAGEFKVIAEVGCKDANKVMPPSEWIEELQSFLAAGASYVITEGRDSATAGIYRTSGEIREGLLSDILKSVDRNKIIFEAPDPKNQMFFIKLIGPNVNLGNVPATALLLLESQRRALRYETFFLPTT